MDLTELEGPVAQRRIGVIAPFDLALDRELWRWLPDQVSLHLTRTPFEPVPVSVQMAQLVGESLQLAGATRDVLHIEPEVVAYLCTSGSFVNGIAAEANQRQVIVDAGAPDAVTTSGALVEALWLAGLKRVAVVTPYDAELTGRLRDFLGEAGVETVASEHLGLTDGIWRIGYRTTAECVLRVNRPEADAIFVSCTNLASYDLIAPLEKECDKPVLTANQVTMWACLRRLGLPLHGPDQWLARVPA